MCCAVTCERIGLVLRLLGEIALVVVNYSLGPTDATAASEHHTREGRRDWGERRTKFISTSSARKWFSFKPSVSHLHIDSQGLR